MDSLEKRPYVPPKGRTPVVMEPEVRKKRVALLRRRASVMQRMREEMSKDNNERSLEKIIHFGELLENQTEEIKPLGGVPKSWM